MSESCNLTDRHCTPCDGETPPVTPAEAGEFAGQIDANWKLAEDARQIERTVKRTNFRDALAFVNRVGELAEAEGHHPDICIRWNRVTLTLSTHAIDGLSENDFILAARIDRLLKSA
jgi:4a-hydroxytetrahydrobiopterin dehydratase